jgi:hypothetical protein
MRLGGWRMREEEAPKRRRPAMASRSAFGRSGAAAALAVLVAVVVGGCAGLTVPTPPTGDANGSGGNAGGGATVANACTLLTTTEIQSTVGHAVATTTPFEIGDEASQAIATRVTIPVQIVLQWDDELVPRLSGLALFDAFASSEKTLHANSGRHAEVPRFEIESAERFFTRHLAGDPNRVTLVP